MRPKPVLKGTSDATAMLVFDAMRRLLPFLVWMPLSACFHFGGQAYPAAWPAQMNGACSSIAGSYVDAGERIGTNSYKFDSLSSAIGHYKSLPFRPPTDRVAISFGDDGAMNVKVWGKERLVGAMQFSRDTSEFQCRWGAIEIGRSEFSAGEQVAGWGSETIQLSKALDGSLILKRSNSAVGVTGGVIPVIANETVSWSRFAIANSN